MLYLAVDSDGTENLFINEHPIRKKIYIGIILLQIQIIQIIE